MQNNTITPSFIEYAFLIIIAIVVLIFILKALCLTKKDQDVDIYKKVDPFAKNIKFVLQMFIGFGLAWLIILKLLFVSM